MAKAGHHLGRLVCHPSLSQGGSRSGTRLFESVACVATELGITVIQRGLRVTERLAPSGSCGLRSVPGASRRDAAGTVGDAVRSEARAGLRRQSAMRWDTDDPCCGVGDSHWTRDRDSDTATRLE